MKLTVWNSDHQRPILVQKVPLRISIIGGGTDMPEFVEEAGWGMCLSLSINHGVAAVAQFSRERCEPIVDQQCDTPLTKAILERFNKTGVLKKVSMFEDVPTIGTGLGSSSAWTVALSRALTEVRGADASISAAESFYIERHLAGHSCGYQDHAAASFGSSGIFTFNKSATPRPEGGWGVNFVNRDLPSSTWLQNRVSLYRVEGKRDSSALLAEQAARLHSHDTFNVYLRMRDLAEKFVVALINQDEKRCGMLLQNAWELKRAFGRDVTNDVINAAVDSAISAGAYSAKIMGAGSAGYLMVYRPVDCSSKVDSAMKELGHQKITYGLHGRLS